ncbi:MAG: hypothetical protein IKL03_06880 [Bacteroidaceae bacterium]|nr:hypothetical protein [Bacteroidaceae bacterium]
MKKNLRLLCLGLAAATITAGFAQENVTSKLRNADMEQGVRGWGIDGESNIFGKNTKVGRPGFHGVNNMVLENWRADGTGLDNNSISQTVRELPAGTYVFGAYVAASLQGSEESNKDVVEGVTLFANEAGVPVATDNPDRGHLMKWAHTGKFNVAATVAEGGSLEVGLKVEKTNANYVIWDNATLYYFGNMSEADALNEMAKIDMAATVAIADTCLAHKMNVDSLALLNEGITAAKAIATADQLWQLNEDLYWAINKATKSISDYKSFANTLKAAQAVAARDGWNAAAQPDIDALNAAIAEAETIYEEAKLNRVELNEKKAALREATARVELDSMMTVYEDVYLPFVEDLPVSDEVGDYSEAQKDTLVALGNDVSDAYNAVYEGAMTAVEALIYIQKMWDLMEEVKNNPNSVDAFPFTITTSQEANADGRYEYTSRMYTMPFPVTNIRFTFKDVFCPNGAGKGNPPYVALGEFYLYDGDGELIELSADNFNTNAQETTEGGMENICDGNTTSYWHSAWSSSPTTDFHYLEVSIPEELELTTFSFGWIDRGSNKQNIPLVVEVSSISSADADLESAISSAKEMNPYTGTEPGYYKDDVSGFYAALAAAEALVGTEASEEAIYEAIDALETEQGKIDEMQIILPEAGKRYHIISGGPFFAQQGVAKALSVKNDTTYNNWLWWETASADSAQQVFSFEYIANEEGLNYYAIKHEATGLYISDYFDYEGELVNNAFGLSATKDTVELEALGYGQFALHNGAMDGNTSNMIHANNHGGGAGVSGNTVKWTTEAGGASAWYIREMATLPCATKSISDLNFQSAPIHLYEGINTLTLKADKATSFKDLTVYGVLGEEISSTVNVSGSVATVMLDTAKLETFSFVFANSEGVASVEVNASISALSNLQVAYDEAAAVAPERGTEVMQYANLDAYDAAIAGAEKLLASGGTDEQITAAIAALEKAVAELAPNMPDPDKTYFIVNALPAFEENHGVPMMLYATEDGTPRWMYENVDKQNRYWKFVPDTEVEEGAPAAYYLLNVGTGKYMGTASGQSSPLAMAEEPDGTTSYNIVPLEGTTVAIAATTDAAFRIHANGHGGGSNKSGNIVYWNSGLGTASIWKICETEAYISDIDFTEIEEGADEYVAPAKKGIFDLFGRRIEAPAATGIYIVDGKKRVIKK